VTEKNNVDYSLVQPKYEQTDEGTLQYKLEMYQRAIREWAGSLSTDELAVTMYVIDRTIGWGQPSATITAGSVINGGGMYNGLNISRATYFRILGTLEEKGLIRRRKTGTGSNRISVNPGWTPAMLNLPKRLKTDKNRGSQAETTPSHSETTPSQAEPLYTGNPSTDNSFTDTVAASGHNSNPKPEVVRKEIEKAASGQRSARKAKANRTKGRTDVSTGIEATWRAALEETFPAVSHVPWDVRIRKNVKDKAKAWAHGGQVSFDDLIDWAVRNWAQIISKQFKWMKKKAAPTQPDISFFLYFAPNFMNTWTSGELDDWLKRPERTKIEKLVGKGRTREEAEMEIATDRAAEQMEDQNKAAVAKAKQIRGEARIVRDQAKAYAESVNVPPRRRKKPIPPLKVTGEVDPSKVIVPILPEKNPYD